MILNIRNWIIYFGTVFCFFRAFQLMIREAYEMPQKEKYTFKDRHRLYGHLIQFIVCAIILTALG